MNKTSKKKSGQPSQPSETQEPEKKKGSPMEEKSCPPTEKDGELPGPEAVDRDRYLRLQADFENFRKRAARERTELFSLANERLMEDLLPVLDHFEMGLAQAKKEDISPAVMEGFRLVYDQCLAALAKSGLEAFDAIGEAFDPHSHEAVSHIPSDEHPADRVIAQLRRGYRLGSRLLRPAQVVVSSGSADGPEPSPPDA